jgi:hypothetical protein
MADPLENLAGQGNNTRNLGEYEGLLEIDELLVNELLKAAQAVAKAL